MPDSPDEYLNRVLEILSFNECPIDLDDWEPNWVALCYIRRDRPIECAQAIAIIRDDVKKVMTPWARRLETLNAEQTGKG